MHVCMARFKLLPVSAHACVYGQVQTAASECTCCVYGQVQTAASGSAHACVNIHNFFLFTLVSFMLSFIPWKSHDFECNFSYPAMFSISSQPSVVHSMKGCFGAMNLRQNSL